MDLTLPQLLRSFGSTGIVYSAGVSDFIREGIPRNTIGHTINLAGFRGLTLLDTDAHGLLVFISK